MVKLRKGPVCRGRLSDGSACEARVDRPGARCRVCLERLATSPDVKVRRELALDGALPVEVFELLGTDPDDEIRLTISGRQDCPLVVLQRMEHDVHPDVRAAAGTILSSALTPRVLRERGRDNLFTRAEVEAFGQPDDSANEDLFGPPAPGPSTAPRPATRRDPVPLESGRRPANGDTTPAVEPLPAGRDRSLGTTRLSELPGPTHRIRQIGAAPVEQRPGAVGSGFDEVLNRLEALGDRLSSLESVLTSTGDRLGVISERIEVLGDAPAAPAPLRPARSGRAVAPAAEVAATGGSSLVRAARPAELDTGLVIRPDVVVAAWLALIPLLARRRGPGRRLSPPHVGEPVRGPLIQARATAAAELPAKVTTTRLHRATEDPLPIYRRPHPPLPRPAST